VIDAIFGLSMTLGNPGTGTEEYQRLLAYSSIVMPVCLIGCSASNWDRSVFYPVYLVQPDRLGCLTFGAPRFDEIADYAALSRRAPGLALVIMVAFLSLAGMPPLGGFVAKVFVFAAAVKSNFVWLAVIGVLNSIVGLYYYLIVLKVVYLYRSEDEDKPVPISRPYTLALTVLVIGIILLGTLFAPWFDWASNAAAALF
jgi:NADH-quinone oxidoreductase subunit N